MAFRTVGIQIAAQIPFGSVQSTWQTSNERGQAEEQDGVLHEGCLHFPSTERQKIQSASCCVWKLAVRQSGMTVPPVLMYRVSLQATALTTPVFMSTTPISGDSPRGGYFSAGGVASERNGAAGRPAALYKLQPEGLSAHA
jgi:hypothetical protein